MRHPQVITHTPRGRGWLPCLPSSSAPNRGSRTCTLRWSALPRNLHLWRAPADPRPAARRTTSLPKSLSPDVSLGFSSKLKHSGFLRRSRKGTIMRRNLRWDFILPASHYIHLVASGCNARRWQVAGSEVQPSPLGRGCRAAGVFISRSATGEGSVPRPAQRPECAQARPRTIQMANRKGQMANGLRFNKCQILNHLNFAICPLPFELVLFRDVREKPLARPATVARGRDRS